MDTGAREFKLGEFALAYAGGFESRKRGRRGIGEPEPLISRGRVTKGFLCDEGEDGVEMRVLSSRSIRSFTVDGELESALMRRDVPDCAVTREGDIVVCGSSPYRVACIDEDHAGLFVPINFIVVRFDEERADLVGDFPAFDMWYWAACIARATEQLRKGMDKYECRWQMTVEYLKGVSIPAAEPAERDEIVKEAKRIAGERAAGRGTVRVAGGRVRRERAEPAGDAVPAAVPDRPHEEPDVTRVAVKVPTWILDAIDAEADNLALQRRAVMIMWLAEKARQMEDGR